jgi:hypothetical protein
MSSLDFFNLPNLFSHTTALESTQPLTELSTRNPFMGVKGGGSVRLTNLPPSVSQLSRENVGASMPHNPMSLDNLLEGQLYLFYQLY